MRHPIGEKGIGDNGISRNLELPRYKQAKAEASASGRLVSGVTCSRYRIDYGTVQTANGLDLASVDKEQGQDH
jgi:hypothetical protein